MASSVRNRISTMRNTVAKALCPEPQRLTTEQRTLRKELLNLDGTCEYCRKRRATSKDHFKPVILTGGYPSDFCNDEWNTIPCCKECNSSKGNRDLYVWMEGKSEQNPFKDMTQDELDAIKGKFQRYEGIFFEYAQRKTITKETFDMVMKPIEEGINEAVRQIQIVKDREFAETLQEAITKLAV